MADKYYSQITNVNLSSGNYILVIPGWYPTPQDPYTGDFNQRHVNAAGIYVAQVVLYVVKDKTNTLKKTAAIYKQAAENIVEIIVTYRQRKNKWIDAVYSNLTYVRLLFTYAAIIKAQFGLPLLVHSYIVIRGGLGGLLLSKKWRIPFILSENWTIYYPDDPGYLLKRNLIFRWTVKAVFKNLNKFLPVTDNLKQHVFSVLNPVPFSVIPNVVNTKLFQFKEKLSEDKIFRFVHVSTMTYQKNPEGLLRAFKKFSEIHPSSVLLMVGPYTKDLNEYAKEIGLNETTVHFTGLISYTQVAEILMLSNALVLFSRYENLPCVILEALCCGLPVISTDVGGITEVVDVHNGILIQNENEEQLKEAFIKMYNSFKDYNPKKISDLASNLFSYESVGGLISSVYEEITI